MAVAYINFVKVNSLPYINKAAQLPKACQSGLDQETDGSIEQVSLRIFNNPVSQSEHTESYLSKLRRDSIGTDFQSVRKLTNYICAKPLELLSQ